MEEKGSADREGREGTKAARKPRVTGWPQNGTKHTMKYGT